jgi:hypothetical protein
MTGTSETTHRNGGDIDAIHRAGDTTERQTAEDGPDARAQSPGSEGTGAIPGAEEEKVLYFLIILSHMAKTRVKSYYRKVKGRKTRVKVRGYSRS